MSRARVRSANACESSANGCHARPLVNVTPASNTRNPLIVRNLSDDLVKALKQQAAKRNRSAGQEHREILKAALRGPRRRSLADVLAAIPNVGEDADFSREQQDRRG